MRRGRVLLVDPSEEWLAALHALLAEDPDLEVVGRARCGAEAVQRAADLRPDLVLMDVALPDTSGYQVVEELKSRHRGLLVLLTTAHRRRTTGMAAILAGADGCLLKAELSDRLLPLLGELLLKEELPRSEPPSTELRRLHRRVRTER